MPNDTIITGRKYRILADASRRLWNVISFWTKAQDVEFNDGSDLQSRFTSLADVTTQNTTKINNLSINNGASVNAAPLYDPTKKYQKGDIVNYNGAFYYAIVNINTPEAWNASHWQVISETLPFKFGIDPFGKYGYIKAGADSVTPFSGKMTLITDSAGSAYTFNQHYSNIMIIYYAYRHLSWSGDENNRWRGTISVTLNNTTNLTASPYLLTSVESLTDTADQSDNNINTYAICAVDDIQQNDTLTFNRSIVLVDGSGSGTIYPVDFVRRVIIGIE